MRISISGTHFMGKTTLVQDFIQAHPNYTCVNEPYYKLLEENNSALALAPSLDGFIEQLDYSIEQFETFTGDDIIFDRCPLDFIAYALGCADEEQLDLNQHEISERFPKLIELLQQLDLMVFLPITAESSIIYMGDNPEYRVLADHNFKKIFREDIFNLFPEYNQPKIIEVVGEPKKRISTLESYL